MNRIGTLSPVVHASLAVAEGLDIPHLQLVKVEPENPFLQHLAPLENLTDTWHRAVSWMQGPATPHQRVSELRGAYYQLFLRPGQGLSLYLHDWMSPGTAFQALVQWSSFIAQRGLTPMRHWSAGRDHLSVVFEVLAWLWDKDENGAHELWRTFLKPWFSLFLDRWQQNNPHPFYQCVLEVAREVGHEMADLD